MTRVAAIMAGGYGERFWPLARRHRPKQLLPLSGSGQTMLQDALGRLDGLFEPEHVVVSTSRSLREAVARATPEVPYERILAEPAKRNTAGCLAWTTAHMMAKHDGDFVLAVLTSDHDIRRLEAFQRTVRTALDQAEQGGLVTVGIRPTRPETGFGYIQFEPGDGAVRQVRRFHEKPGPEKAMEYLDCGEYLWNSGMFFWKASIFLDELRKVDPAYAQSVESMAQCLREGDEATAEQTFLSLPDTSIDYLLMEKAESVLVVEAEFEWDDLGTLASLEGVLPLDAAGNASRGASLFVDTDNCLVLNEVPGTTVCALGLHDIVIVATGDCILVLPKDRTQDVRKVVAEAERKGLDV